MALMQAAEGKLKAAALYEVPRLAGADVSWRGSEAEILRAKRNGPQEQAKGLFCARFRGALRRF